MVNLKEYLVVVNNRLIPLTGAITEDQLIDPAIAPLQLLEQVNGKREPFSLGFLFSYE
jgi:hypothetical protein